VISGPQLGFLESGGIYTTIDPPGSHGTEPINIDAKGEVIGVYRDGDGMDHGFLYSHGSYTILDVPGALDTYAYSINDKGSIAGYYLINPGQNGGQNLGFEYSQERTKPATT
jgi:hypothetical protein